MCFKIVFRNVKFFFFFILFATAFADGKKIYYAIFQLDLDKAKR